MPDALALVHRTQQARELFFDRDQAPDGWIAPHITRSWVRSRSMRLQEAGLTPIVAPLLRQRRETSRLLLDSAQPELDALAEHAISNGCVVIVTDASGVILEEIGSPDFLTRAQRFALLPGVEWSEGQCGTNAIGTVLVEREALAVLGGEHFLPANSGLGCAASPIFTGRGAIAGVLDVSGDAVRVDAHTLGMVRMASQQIEHRMLLSEAQGHVLRFHVNHGVLGSAREGVMTIVDGHVVAANRIALGLMQERWDTLLDQPVEKILGNTWQQLARHPRLTSFGGNTQVVASLERVQRRSSDAARSTVTSSGDSVALTRSETALRKAVRILDAGIPVLVTGETGVGKEVFAKQLHRASTRASGPFVAVNCAALPESLIEAELFGYDEGAFTGARRRGVTGRIREAHGGVLLLDEIGDMPLALQTRLLRVLEEREVTPLGGGRAHRVEFRLICATHCDLPALVAEGKFRSDLLYRVNGYEVQLPALRDRTDKRDLFARVFAELGADSRDLALSEEVLAAFESYTWPGNMRELVSVLRTMMALAEDGEMLQGEHVPEQVRAHYTRQSSPANGVLPLHTAALASIEQEAIERALGRANGNVAVAARELGIHRSTIYRYQARRTC